jgi:N-acetylglutamate synthase
MPVVVEPSWVGRRVSIRRAVDRAPDGRLLFGDVVGELVSLDSGVARVETSSGLVAVPVSHVAAGRIAHPSTADELALEAVAARGWLAAERAHLGGWVLRASGGFTGRANSVLPLRASELPLDEAIEQARAWYAARRLPVRFQLPVEARRLLDAELAERGWPAEPDVHVMTARLDMLRGATGRTPSVALDSELPEGWLSVYRGGKADRPEARALLVNHDTVAFATVHDGRHLVAIGRGAIDDDWLGITAVEVVPSHRRHGLATAVTLALRDWGRAQSARRGYLQVSSDNPGAIALYERLGFWHHHDYRYRTDPQA